jgi:hypothetical protein
MFQVMGYISISRPCFGIHVFLSNVCLNSCFSPCFSSSFFAYSFFFLRYMFLCFYVSLFPSIQKTFIQKFHHLFIGCYVSYLQLLTFVTFSLVLLLLCLTFLGCFWDFSFSFLRIGWEALKVKHLQAKVLKVLQHELTCPSPCCMPPYCPRRKFDFDDNTIIVSKITSKRINSILQDMGAGSISGEMLKKPTCRGND